MWESHKRSDKKGILVINESFLFFYISDVKVHHSQHLTADPATATVAMIV